MEGTDELCLVFHYHVFYIDALAELWVDEKRCDSISKRSQDNYPGRATGGVSSWTRGLLLVASQKSLGSPIAFIPGLCRTVEYVHDVGFRHDSFSFTWGGSRMSIHSACRSQRLNTYAKDIPGICFGFFCR